MLKDVTEILRTVQSDVNELRSFASKFDQTRKVMLYTRQSHLSEEMVNYREAQANLQPALIDAGVAPDALIVLNDDDHSAVLNERYRLDYQRLLEAVDDNECGTIVCMDISRLHRDPTHKQQVYLAALMEARAVCVLTKHDNKWTWLDMTNEIDRKTYLDLAGNAAQERKKLRAISMTARLHSVMKGGASGGGSIPFGWRLIPKMDKRESEDGKRYPPRTTIYPPHARLKLDIMRASLLPHIKTHGDLRTHLMENGFIIPPFDPSLSMKVFTRSSMSRVFRKEGTKRVYLGRAESMSEFGHAFLVSALCEPLVIGDVRYGSGQSGHYALQKQRVIAESMKQASDSQITPGRVLVYNDRALALCKSEASPDFPTYDDLLELYHKVAAKWSPVDMEAARAKQYRISPDNPARINRLEKKIGRPLKSVNAWAGFVWCGKHGWDAEEDWPVLAETLKFSSHRTEGGYEQWFCTDQADKGGAMCTNWSGESLRKILDDHLRIRLAVLLRRNDPLFQDLFVLRQKAKEGCDRLKRDVERLETELRRKQDKFNRFDDQLADAPDSERNTVLNAILTDEIKPLMGVLAEKKAGLAQAVKDSLDTDSLKTETELRRDLQGIMDNYDRLPTARKRHAIGLLVDNIVVITGDGIEANDCIILWQWTDGRRETLVGWRDCVRDNRDWTEEEDAALHRLWGTAADYTEIKAALLPGRNFWSMRLRAQKVKAGKRGKIRKVSLAVQAQEADKTWHDRNPDVLYLQITDIGPTERQEEAVVGERENSQSTTIMCRFITGDYARDFESGMLGVPLPPEVGKGVRMIIDRFCCSRAGF